jgi:hypothetical protein
MYDYFNQRAYLLKKMTYTMRWWLCGLWLCSNALGQGMVWAQPNDHSFSLVFFTSQGFFYCNPASADVMTGQVEEFNEKKTFVPTDTMRCVQVQGEADDRLYTQYWQGLSWENTRAVRIVFGGDTMVLDTEKAPIHWKLNPNGGISKFPLPVYFQKGWYIWGDYKDSELDRMYYNSINRTAILRDMPILEWKEKHPVTCETERPTYWHRDTVTVRLTGTCLTDGSCSDYMPLYSLMRWNGAAWTLVYEDCCTQMDCGMGRRLFVGEETMVFRVKCMGVMDSEHTWNSVKVTPGLFRLVFYQDDSGMVVTNEFEIIE